MICGSSKYQGKRAIRDRELCGVWSDFEKARDGRWVFGVGFIPSKQKEVK